MPATSMAAEAPLCGLEQVEFQLTLWLTALGELKLSVWHVRPISIPFSAGLALTAPAAA